MLSKDFKFNKAFGQNFLKDKNLLTAIVRDSGVSETDEVLEIGAGAGALTKAISSVAAKVVSYEIDKKLTEYLAEEFAGCENVKIIMSDALKLPIEEIENNFSGDYFIIANLPYYITTPLIFKFLEQTNRAKVLTIMVQREVAEKAISRPGSPDYGILSVMLSYYSDAKIMRIVKKDMFTPKPKVDSAILRLERKPNVSYNPQFTRFVKGAFAMKRKTILNNLSKLGYEKENILAVLKELEIPQSARSETLSLEQFRQIQLKLDKCL